MNNIETISRDELTAKIARHDKFRLVDVDGEEKFHEVHLPGAINLPPDRLSALAPKRLRDREADIVVYSTDSDEAERAARELVEEGYTHVREYAEGKQDWIDSGLPVVSDIPRNADEE
jgi:rhodanese-related sulfurtransferase